MVDATAFLAVLDERIATVAKRMLNQMSSLVGGRPSSLLGVLEEGDRVTIKYESPSGLEMVACPHSLAKHAKDSWQVEVLEQLSNEWLALQHAKAQVSRSRAMLREAA